MENYFDREVRELETYTPSEYTVKSFVGKEYPGKNRAGFQATTRWFFGICRRFLP